jgi:hypothetical protein
MISKSDNKTPYLDLVNAIDAERVLLHQVPDLDLTKGRYLAIRHDIDYDMEKAVKMARLEYDNGISSTYFVLPSAPYFRCSEVFARILDRIGSMGHEIGLHNDFLTTYLTQSEPKAKGIIEVIAEPLQFLRNHGFRCYGTAAHGTLHARENGYVNYHVWTECPEKNFEAPTKVTFPRITMKAFDFKYEAYYLPRDAYLTDSGHHWQAFVRPDYEPFERMKNPIADPFKAIELFNTMEAGIMQCLFHPVWWGDDDLG